MEVVEQEDETFSNAEIMDEGSSSNEQSDPKSVYIFGHDEEFVESVKSMIFPGNDQLVVNQLPLEAVKLQFYAMADDFNPPRSRAFLLLEIVVQAFSNDETIEQILIGHGFNDKLSAPEHFKELLVHKLVQYNADELKSQKLKLATAALNSSPENESNQLYIKLKRDINKLNDLLDREHFRNNQWVAGKATQFLVNTWNSWQVDILETGVQVQMILQPGGDAFEDNYCFIIRIPSKVTESAQMASTDSMFNDDEEDIHSLNDPIVDQSCTIHFELRKDGDMDVHGKHESDFDLTCALNEVTKSTIENGIRTCFPWLVSSPFTLLGELNQPLTSDQDLRNYLQENDKKVIRIISLSAGIAEGEQGEAPESSYNLTSLPQKEVAQQVLKRVSKVLTTEEDPKNLALKFKRTEYLIMVPKYNTLKQQTKDRILEHHNLVRPGEDVAYFVELYSGKKLSNSPSEKFKRSVLDAANKDTLFVLVVDECHYAPTATSIPLLHDLDMRKQENLVVLLISATPYNCLSTNSSIPTDNIVDWTSTVSATYRPSYVGFEHYFRSTAFRVPLSACSAITVNNVQVNLKALEKQEFGEFSHLAKVISDLIAKALEREPFKISCKFIERVLLDNERVDRNEFQLSLDRGGGGGGGGMEIIEVADTVDEGLLHHLGFRSSATTGAAAVKVKVKVKVSLSKLSKQVRATAVTTIDKETPIENQLIRADQKESTISAIYAEPECKAWKHTKKANSSPLPSVRCMLLPNSIKARYFGFNKNATTNNMRLQNMMLAKNGFTVIVDYILSLAYFGSTMKLGLRETNGDLRTMAIGDVAKDALVESFLLMLDRSCYFQTEKNVGCNLGPGMNAALSLMCRSFRSQEAGAIADEMDDLDCLACILILKIQQELSRKTSSGEDTWFTESDRIVRKLLYDRQPAPMVIVRVYDNDENRSMQQILRNAMRVCELNNKVTERGEPIPAFCVISDNSDTSLLSEIEPYYRYEFDIGGKLFVNDIPRMRAEKQKKESLKAKINFDLKYEDLLNVPCIIILCEKGRMGDTFPHTLSVLDLRMRSGGTATCFLQELGRMCRYPKTREEKTFRISEKDNIASYFPGEHYYPAGSTSSSHPDNTAPHGLVITGNRGYLGIAKSMKELDFILYTEYGTTSGASQDEIVSVAPLEHPLPYALVGQNILTNILKIITARERAIAGDTSSSSGSYSALREKEKLLYHFKPVETVDEYLKDKTILPIGPEYQYTLRPKNSKKANKPNLGHYDKLRLGLHDRRFLLSAECQVGKTGAFLYFLSELRREIEQQPQLPSPPPPPLIPYEPWWHWLVPRIDNLVRQGEFDYAYPINGKYHGAIAHHRLEIALKLILDSSSQSSSSSSSSSSSDVVKGFIEYVQENELTVTRRGLARIDKLRMLDDFTPLSEAGSNKAKSILEKLLNWDGRFPRHNPNARMFDGSDRLLEEFADLLVNNKRVKITKAKEVLWSEDYEEDLVDGVDNPGSGNPGKPVFQVRTKNPTVITEDYTAKTWKQWNRYNTRSGCGSIVITVPVVDVIGSSSSEVISAFKLSIPYDAIDDWKLPGSKTLRSASPKDIVRVLKRPEKIKNWIFTASYCGRNDSSYVMGPDEKLLMREDAFSVPPKNGGTMYDTLTRWVDYAELLIVRRSQFADYRSLYGSTHVIASLPDTMDVRLPDSTTIKPYNVKDGGIGYARLFGQHLASYIELKAVWMLDDNNLQCWKILCSGLESTPETVQPSEPASFAEVMIHIESLFQDSSWERSFYPNMKEQADHAMRSSNNKSSLNDIAGTFDRYGVVGVCRGQQWRQNISDPIKRSYSVYSFFLLNVEATVSRNLFFPCRPIWEDIEFNNLLDENGLMVCKMQVFAHEKPHRPSPKLPGPVPEPEPEPEPELLSPSQSLVQWLNQHYQLSASSIEDVMVLISENEYLAQTREELRNSLLHHSSTEGNDCVLFVHNPTVEQREPLVGYRKPFMVTDLIFLLPLGCLNKGGKCVLVFDRSKLISDVGIDYDVRLDDMIASLVSPFAITKVNTLPDSSAERYVVIQIAYPVEEGIHPMYVSSETDVMALKVQSKTPEPAPKRKLVAEEEDKRLALTSPDTQVQKSFKRISDKVTPPQPPGSGIKRSKMGHIVGEESKGGENSSVSSREKSEFFDYHSAAYVTRWRCCGYQDKEAKGCQRGIEVSHHPQDYMMMSSAQGERANTWLCCQRKREKYGKNNQGCKAGPHPNPFPTHTNQP